MFVITCRKRDICSLCILKVESFVHQFERDTKITISTSLIDLVLFIYAHPITINCKYENITENISFCCITDWNSVRLKVKNTFDPLPVLTFEHAGKQKMVSQINCDNELHESNNKIFTIMIENYIHFEFQMPYFAALISKELFNECISKAVTYILSGQDADAGHIFTLDKEAIEISEINVRPNDTNPKRIKVIGWIKCGHEHRQIFITALELAQRSRKICKQIANKISVRRTKIRIQQFSTRFAN
eukprot:24552_1